MTCKPSEVSRVQKTQVIRVLDVMLVGPLMVMGGRDMGRRSPIMGGLLEFFGISTIAYNARNWYRVEQSMLKEKRRQR